MNEYEDLLDSYRIFLKHPKKEHYETGVEERHQTQVRTIQVVQVLEGKHMGFISCQWDLGLEREKMRCIASHLVPRI